MTKLLKQNTNKTEVFLNLKNNYCNQHINLKSCLRLRLMLKQRPDKLIWLS